MRSLCSGPRIPYTAHTFTTQFLKRRKLGKEMANFFRRPETTVSEQKEQNLDHESKILCCRSMSFLHHSQHVVGGPGQDEHQQDGGQRLGRLALLTNQRWVFWVSTNHSSPGASPASPSSACSSSGAWRRAWGRAWRPAPRRSSHTCNIRLSISRINI